MKIKFFFILFLVLFLPITLLAENIVINEFMSDNGSFLKDADREYPDWIELYNAKTDTVNMKGFTLSDDKDFPAKWVFPSIKIPPKSLMVVFVSGKNRKSQNELHTNFAIDSEGESIYLYDKRGRLIDKTDSVNLREDHSYGRYPDGAERKLYFLNPTPLVKNVTNDQIIFSKNSGFYPKPFYLELKSLLGDSIYYAYNGKIPDTSSNLYQSPFKIKYRYNDTNRFANIPTSPEQKYITYPAWEAPADNIHKANVIRFASFKNGKLNSRIYSKTFFVDSTIFQRYHLPVVSIITKPENFFDHYKGIYVPGYYLDSSSMSWSGNYNKRGEAWEKPIHIEYFSTDGELKLEQDAGVRIHGAGTRVAAQKSLRLYARKEYREKYFNYPMLPDRKQMRYKRILLRSTMCDWDNKQTMLKDISAHEIIQGMNLEYQDQKPVVLYLNGEYWGIHVLRDRIDERYISYLHGVDKDSVRIINGWYYLDGPGKYDRYVNLKNFVENNDLSLQVNYN